MVWLLVARFCHGILGIHCWTSPKTPKVLYSCQAGDGGDDSSALPLIAKL